MIPDNIKGYKILLASQSPRRRELLKELGLKFEVCSADIDESYPDDMPHDVVPVYLAEKKADFYKNKIEDKQIIITSDTIVSVEEMILGKPSDYHEAYEMLKSLSGKWHKVATGVCIFSKTKKVTFNSITNVRFKVLTHEEIDFYITNFKPFDKAGAYGIQEWIGYIAVEEIEGSYFNVIGLPVQRLYEELCIF
jgi:septum formation protein